MLTGSYEGYAVPFKWKEGLVYPLPLSKIMPCSLTHDGLITLVKLNSCLYSCLFVQVWKISPCQRFAQCHNFWVLKITFAHKCKCFFFHFPHFLTLWPYWPDWPGCTADQSRVFGFSDFRGHASLIIPISQYCRYNVKPVSWLNTIWFLVLSVHYSWLM